MDQVRNDKLSEGQRRFREAIARGETDGDVVEFDKDGRIVTRSPESASPKIQAQEKDQ
jgi:hypothetical protein